ncbi:hypothetical protein NHX12_000829, partial [Muraenolepis orangiensis]
MTYPAYFQCYEIIGPHIPTIHTGHELVIVYENLEYTIVNNSMNWMDAVKYCRVQHTDLATIQHVQDLDKLKVMTLSPLSWIGLYDDLFHWRYSYEFWQSDSIFSATSFINWASGQPSNDGGQELCVMMTEDGSWDDRTVHYLNILCVSLQESKMQRIVLMMFLFGPIGLVFAYEYLEYTFVNNSMNWMDAVKYCRVEYTDLATIQYVQDLTKLKAMTLSPLSWIGLYDDLFHW